MESLAGNLLTARQNRLGGPEGDGGRGPFEAAHDTRDHQADLFLELVVDRIPLRFADLLDDDLLGRLGTDPPRQFGRVDLHTVTAAMDAPVGTIDRDLHIGGFAVLPRQSGDEGRLDRLKDDLLVDVFVAVNRIDDAEDFFWLHGCLGRRSRRTRSWSVFLGTARGERRQVSILRMSALPRNRLSKSDHASQAATATSGTLTRRWQRCPEPASPPGTLACGTMPDGRRHTRTGRPPSHATPKGNPPSETRHPTALRTPAATSTRHNPEGYGEGTRLSRSFRPPRGGWGRRTLVPRRAPQAQAPRFQPPITTAPACPWGVTEAERKEAPASSPATAARIGHSGSGVV